MKLEVNNHNIFLIVLVTFLTSALLVPLIKKVAIHVGAIDKPNERRINKVAMPTQGGIAIFLSFMVGYMLYAPMTTQMLSILMGGILIILMGFVDGVNSLKARYQLVVQIAAALIVTVYGRIYINEISLFGTVISFPTPINYIFSILFMISVINAINLIDGLDGLCSGVSSIYFLTISIIAFILNKAGGLDTILALIMLGSTLGVLLHNFPPAKIYLGNTGSMFLGYMISVISLLGFKVATMTSLVIPLLILAIPIFDTASAIIRRVLKKRAIDTPDKEHIHHQLLKMKFSTKVTVLIIYVINILFACVSILYVLGDAKQAIAIYVLLMLLLLFIIMKTNILFEHKKNKNK